MKASVEELDKENGRWWTCEWTVVNGMHTGVQRDEKMELLPPTDESAQRPLMLALTTLLVTNEDSNIYILSWHCIFVLFF